MKHIILILGFLCVIPVHAAMVRVVDVQDGRTLVIDRNGTREAVRLAGVAILDEARAADLLRWNVVSTWVLVEPRPSGDALVFRSPDALFINRELVLRGYARATEHGIEPERNVIVTYLGEIHGAAPPVTASARSRTSSDTSRRSSAQRSPRARGARRGSSGRTPTSDSTKR